MLDFVLKRMRYESSGGSMNFHSEFEIEVSSDEIIRTAYWNDYYFSAEEEAEHEKLAEIDASFRINSAIEEMTVREHIPTDKELWTALTEEVEYLKEQLKPVTNKRPALLPPNVFVLDGGDYSRLYLTWDTGDGETTVQYYSPSGKRWWSVISILHEMVRPVSRDLCRIGETQLTDFMLKAPKYSYQIKPISGSSNYYLFVHGDESPKSRISQEEWLKVRDFLTGIDLSSFGSGKYDDKYYLRLSYNDGISKNLEINKKVAENIREYIRKNII